MLASITPLGERGRSNRWGTTVVAHLVGALALGAGQGAALGALGDGAPLGARGRAAGLVVVTAAAVGLDLVHLPRPGFHRQVAESWLDTYRGWVYGAGFGAQLAVGWATIVTTWLVWATLAASFLAGSALGGAAVGTAFALGRALPVLATWRVRDAGGLRALHRRLAAWEGSFRRGSLAGASVLALLLAVTT